MFSMDDKTIVTSDNEGFIHVWDVETGDRVNHFKAHTGDIISVELSPH